ncbi:MAG: redoxin domain-containing protein [Acidobacteria bacterium]|nr:redoxin domain-containing protein [Acidobacteriota bacterium]
MLMPGDEAPDFDLAACTGERKHRVRLSEYRGRTNVVLVFYVLAFTPV